MWRYSDSIEQALETLGKVSGAEFIEGAGDTWAEMDGRALGQISLTEAWSNEDALESLPACLLNCM